MRTLQSSLNTIGGVPRLAVDGVYGVLTASRVQSFQVLNGLPVTGAADDATQRAIDHAVLARTPSGNPPGNPSPTTTAPPPPPPPRKTLLDQLGWNNLPQADKDLLKLGGAGLLLLLFMTRFREQ